jgi:hypothetical protein
MKKGFLLSIALLSLLTFAGSAPALDFSADQVTKSSGQTMNSTIYVKGAKVRMDMKDRGQYTIMRPDKNVTWMVMPEQKSYMEMKHDPRQEPKVGEKVQGEVSRKLIGSEKIDKYDTKKYEVTYKQGDKTDRMYQWIATEIQFPVKMAAVDGSWSTEYRNIKMSPPPDSLFEAPEGYKKMGMPGMPGMPAMPAMPGKMKGRPGPAGE